jgi:hypothetical protein
MPVVQLIDPSKHSPDDGVHVAPAAHPLQWPEPSQTPPGQAIPAATFPLVVHIGEPLAQSICPVAQGLPVEHDAPVVQATHVPAPSHTPPGQVAPAVALVLPSHRGIPAEQLVIAMTQAFPVSHGEPAAHAMQVPDPSHTPPGHIVPAG